MTRFARAKGSKSCNDKTPEEATSWSEMKKAIISKSSTPAVAAEEAVVTKQKEKDKKIKAKWASLDNDTVEDYFALIRQHHNKEKNNVPNETKQKQIKKKQINSSSKESNTSTKINKSVDQVVKKEDSVLDAETGEVNLFPNKNKNNQKTKNKRKLNGFDSNEPSIKRKTKTCSAVQDEADQKNSEEVKSNSNVDVKTNEVINKKKKAKKSAPNIKAKKIKKDTYNSKTPGNHLNAINGKSNNNSENHYKNDRKSKKKKDFKGSRDKFNKNHNKQSIVEELNVNGKKIQIVKFQGFNVTLEDAERLKNLRAEMFKEGIPKVKLEAALKLERRRAEKALSRLKKAVCFHCRGFGHVLSECPSLTESQNTGTGICYKCGSTEHFALECKVVRGSSFQYAECFICKEQGHIAKQCPDNPRGLYPHGGACRECGDVTHLRKDCPKAVSKTEDDRMTVGIRNDRNLELLDEEIARGEKKNLKKTSTKKSIVKF